MQQSVIDVLIKMIASMLFLGQIVEPLVNLIKKYIPAWSKLDKYTKQLVVVAIGLAVAFCVFFLGPQQPFDFWQVILIGIGSSLDARILHDIASYLEKLKDAQKQVITQQKLEG